MSSRIRSRLAAAGASTVLSGAMVLGLAGTASAQPAAASTAPSAAPAVALASFAAPENNRRCFREFHRASWFWSDDGWWDRDHHWWHHRNRHFRPGWWEWHCW